MPQGYDTRGYDIGPYDQAADLLMSVFDRMARTVATAVAAAYADDAVFLPAAGGSTDCRIVMAFHNQAVDFPGFENRLRDPAHEGHILQVELPTRPLQGDSVQVLTGTHVGTYTVRDCYEDLERTEWVLDLS